MKFKYYIDYPNKTVFGVGKTFFGLVYRSKAVCSETDTFDFSKGREIVRLKIAQKQLQSIEKDLKHKIKMQEEFVDSQYNVLSRYHNKHKKLLDKKEKIEKRLKEF